MSLALYFNHMPVFIQSDTAATVFFAARFYVATIRGRLLFQGGYYSRAVTIPGQLLFQGGYYSRVATVQEQLLFESGYYSSAAFISLESTRASTTAG